eukprot:1049591-Prymnesium_polylepis.2
MSATPICRAAARCTAGAGTTVGATNAVGAATSDSMVLPGVHRRQPVSSRLCESCKHGHERERIAESSRQPSPEPA